KLRYPAYRPAGRRRRELRADELGERGGSQRDPGDGGQDARESQVNRRSLESPQFEMPTSANSNLIPFQLICTPIASTMKADKRTTTFMPVCPIHAATRSA